MDRSTNVVHYVEAFIRFEDWLMEHRKDYPELPDKVVAMLHGLHDDFLTPFFTKKPFGYIETALRFVQVPIKCFIQHGEYWLMAASMRRNAIP